MNVTDFIGVLVDARNVFVNVYNLISEIQKNLVMAPTIAEIHTYIVRNQVKRSIIFQVKKTGIKNHLNLYCLFTQLNKINVAQCRRKSRVIIQLGSRPLRLQIYVAST